MAKEKNDLPSAEAAEFPKHSLQTALKVPEAIENNNGGNPMPPTDVAIAIDKSPGSSDFRILLSSSIKYGLTTGSYNQARVSLADTGSDIVASTSEEQKNQALFEAAFRPVVFRRVFDAYKGKKVPESQFFQNALVRDFGVSKAHAAKCAAVFLENAKYLGLIRQANSGLWFGQTPDFAAYGAASLIETDDGAEPHKGDDVTPEKPAAPVSSGRAPLARQSSRNAIFVGHGKNKVPLQQLEKFLGEYKIPHKVAIDEPNRNRPISQKVADIMGECDAAIIIFTADEEFKRASGETIFRPSENAVFELGAASALYGSRVVIFKEATVDFPTNFRDIGYIEFEKDNLEAKVNELFRELISFGLLTVSVAAARG